MITLKPQLSLRQHPDGNLSLTSENFNQAVLPENSALLQKLVHGVEPDTLSDTEFDQLIYLADCGFLNTSTDLNAPAWELSGANFHDVQKQFKHITFTVIDQTINGVGESLRRSLLTAGLKEATNNSPRITFAVSDSYLTLPNVRGNMMPIVCNRMRITVGPMVFPWGSHVRDEVAKHKHYLPKPGYELPPVFDALQRAWINVAVLQFIGMNKLRYAGHFVEYNMGQQEFRLWPM